MQASIPVLLLPPQVLTNLLPGGPMPAMLPGTMVPAVSPGTMVPAVSPGSLVPAVLPGSLVPAVSPGSPEPAVSPGSLALRAAGTITKAGTNASVQNDVVEEDVADGTVEAVPTTKMVVRW